MTHKASWRWITCVVNPVLSEYSRVNLVSVCLIEGHTISSCRKYGSSFLLYSFCFLLYLHSNECCWVVLSCGTDCCAVLSWSVAIQMKDTEQYFPVVLFVVLYLVVLTFACVDEILKCDHSNESCRAVLSILLYNVVPTFESVDEILWCDHWREISLPSLAVLSHGVICFSAVYKIKLTNCVTF